MIIGNEDPFGSKFDWSLPQKPASAPAQASRNKADSTPAASRTETADPKPAATAATERPAKVPSKSAADVARLFPLSAEANQLLREGVKPRQYLDLLIAKHHYPDATRFLAHLLPKREAVWWAALCARSAAGAQPPAPITAALQAAEKWVREPNEDNRRAALPAAEAATFGTPAGCTAVAAFWTGGSLGPPQVPVIPPGESFTAHGVAGAIMLAAVTTEPEKAPEKYRHFLAWGINVADGAKRWPERAPPPAPSPKR
jgi:hypothetical protein